MSERDRRTQELYAYHDGELSWWARRRVARRLAHDAAARRELETLSEIGALMHEHAAEAAPVDLWERIRSELPYAKKPTAPPQPEAAWGLGAPQWIAAGLAAAAITAVLAVGFDPSDAPAGSVRWLDARGKPAMVLRDDREATIIWLLEEEERTGMRFDRAIL